MQAVRHNVRRCWSLRGPAPPPVYQAQYDPKALFAALKIFVCPSTARLRVPEIVVGVRRGTVLSAATTSRMLASAS